MAKKWADSTFAAIRMIACLTQCVWNDYVCELIGIIAVIITVWTCINAVTVHLVTGIDKLMSDEQYQVMDGGWRNAELQRVSLCGGFTMGLWPHKMFLCWSSLGNKGQMAWGSWWKWFVYVRVSRSTWWSVSHCSCDFGAWEKVAALCWPSSTECQVHSCIPRVIFCCLLVLVSHYYLQLLLLWYHYYIGCV